MKKIISFFLILSGGLLFGQNLDDLRVLEHVKAGNTKLEIFVYMKDKTDFVNKSSELRQKPTELYGKIDTTFSDSGTVENIKADSVRYEQLAYWNEEDEVLIVYLFANDKLYGASVNYLIDIDDTKKLKAQYKKLNGYVVSNEVFLNDTQGKLLWKDHNADNLVERVYPLIPTPEQFKQVKTGYVLDVNLRPKGDDQVSAEPLGYWAFAELINLKACLLNSIDGYHEYEIPVTIYNGEK